MSVILDSRAGPCTLGSIRTCPACGERWPAALERCPHDDETLLVVEEAPAETLTEGTRIGDYVVTKLLRSTVMSTVYAGVHPLIGKKVAIKVIAAELCAQRDAVLRFVQEARAVNRIGHPNIVDIFTFGTLSDGRCYFVMEWLQGETLAQRLCDDALGFDEKLVIAGQLCDVLAAVHAAGVVHRDLKPDNVFLVRVDGEPRVKLLDFGIAKLASGDGAAPTLTQNGTTMGTPAYVSPEQASGEATGARSDVYGLGVVLYEMFLGRPPFVSESDTQVMVMHVTEAPEPPSELWPNIPPGLEKLLVRMLHKVPERRPDVAEVRTELGMLRRSAAASSEPVRGPFTGRMRAVLDGSIAAPPRRPRGLRLAVPLLLAISAACVAAAILAHRAEAPEAVVPAAAAHAQQPVGEPEATPAVQPATVVVEERAPVPAAEVEVPVSVAPPPARVKAAAPAGRTRHERVRIDEKTLVDPFSSNASTPRGR